MPRVIVHAHRGVGIEANFGKTSLSVPAGGKLETSLPGDHIGHVRSLLDRQEAQERLGPSMFGGRVEVEGEEAGPPPGSKKWTNLVKDGTHKPKHDELKEACIARGLLSENEMKKTKLSAKELRDKLGLVDEEAV